MSVTIDPTDWPRGVPLSAALTSRVHLWPRLEEHRRTTPAADSWEVMDARWEIETVGPSAN
jgi:hypothetical protein